jgi:hypothetical protein
LWMASAGVSRQSTFAERMAYCPMECQTPMFSPLTAQDSRILISHDVHTMPGHFAAFAKTSGWSPGVFLISQKLPIAEAIEEIVLIWSVSDADDWIDRLVWLPV